MNISINGRKLNIRQDLRDLIERKLAKYDKYFPAGADATVTCMCEKDRKIIETTIVVGNTIFRSEQASDSFRTALDRSLEAIERQIRKNKTRLERKMKKSISVPEPEIEEDRVDEEVSFDIHRKSFRVAAMSEEEAVLQMNLIGHNFFLFRNAETDEMNIVYKRHDNSYGVIIPEK